MDSTDLLTKCRQAAFIGDASAYTEYPDLKLLGIMSEKLRTDFPLFAVEARAGYLLKTSTVSTASRTRVPSRAFMGGLYTVECLSQSGKYYPLEEAAAEDAYLFEQQSNAALPRK